MLYTKLKNNKSSCSKSWEADHLNLSGNVHGSESLTKLSGFSISSFKGSVCPVLADALSLGTAPSFRSAWPRPGQNPKRETTETHNWAKRLDGVNSMDWFKGDDLPSGYDYIT